MRRKSQQNEYEPASVSPPGETLRELLDERGISQAELAERTGRPRKTINEILQGKTAITAETALQLELVLGAPATFWNVRESQYREYLARREAKARLAAQVKWAERFPLREMMKKGWLPNVRGDAERVHAILEFLGVASPEQWEAVYKRCAVAFRKSGAFKVDEHALAAWLRMGVRTAERQRCEEYNEDLFLTSLEEARGLTREPPEVFQPHLETMCARAGVAVVFVPQLRGCRAHGATRWLSPKRALIQLSLRYRRDDQLWFTFFHEAAHILFHRKRVIFLEFDNHGGVEEEEANRFAADFLIPPRDFEQIRERGVYSKRALRRWAKELGISPGIIVGRLQHEGLLPFNYCNDLKTRLEWVTETAP